jgi:hypothetical protein
MFPIQGLSRDVWSFKVFNMESPRRAAGLGHCGAALMSRWSSKTDLHRSAAEEISTPQLKVVIISASSEARVRLQDEIRCDSAGRCKCGGVKCGAAEVRQSRAQHRPSFHQTHPDVRPRHFVFIPISQSMSGLEVAGVVLGAFQLIISGLEHWRDVAKVGGFWWRIRKEYTKCRSDVRFYDIVYKRNLKELLMEDGCGERTC